MMLIESFELKLLKKAIISASTSYVRRNISLIDPSYSRISVRRLKLHWLFHFNLCVLGSASTALIFTRSQERTQLGQLTHTGVIDGLAGLVNAR